MLDALVAKLNGDDSSQELRFVRLPHPSTGMLRVSCLVCLNLRNHSGVPSLFLPYTSPSTGKVSVLEVQTVAPPNERSWFMSEGEVLQSARMFTSFRPPTNPDS